MKICLCMSGSMLSFYEFLSLPWMKHPGRAIVPTSLQAPSDFIDSSNSDGHKKTVAQ